MLHVMPFGVILSFQDAAIFSERLAELYFDTGRDRFAHAYLLEALEMWNAIAVDLKVKHLKGRYPDVLGDVALADNNVPSGDPGSTRDSFLHLSSTQSPSTGFCEGTSQVLSSLESDQSGRESTRGTIILWIVNIDGSIQLTLSRSLSLIKAPINSSVVLNILRSVIRAEDINDVLSCLMSELLVCTGASLFCLGLMIRCY